MIRQSHLNCLPLNIIGIVEKSNPEGDHVSETWNTPVLHTRAVDNMYSRTEFEISPLSMFFILTIFMHQMAYISTLM